MTDDILYTSIKCVKCRGIKSVRRDVFLSRVSKFGSIEDLLKRYKCRDCRVKSKSGIQCSCCKEIKAVRKDVYQARIKRYGSEKELLARYLCRKCRKIKKHQMKIIKRGNGVMKRDEGS